jgi:hypothetical protein
VVGKASLQTAVVNFARLASGAQAADEKRTNLAAWECLNTHAQQGNEIAVTGQPINEMKMQT